MILEVGPKDLYDNKVKKLENKTNNRLVIKEYPINVNFIDHFKTLMNELTLKKSFKPNVIFIDYLNI